VVVGVQRGKGDAGRGEEKRLRREEKKNAEKITGQGPQRGKGGSPTDCQLTLSSSREKYRKKRGKQVLSGFLTKKKETWAFLSSSI